MSVDHFSEEIKKKLLVTVIDHCFGLLLLLLFYPKSSLSSAIRLSKRATSTVTRKKIVNKQNDRDKTYCKNLFRSISIMNGNTGLDKTI